MRCCILIRPGTEEGSFTMKKQFVHRLLMEGILLFFYLLFISHPDFEHGRVYWVSFAFTILAFLQAAAAFYIGCAARPGAVSRYFGFLVVKIGRVYLLSQIVVGLLFTITGKNLHVFLPVILYSVLFLLALLSLRVEKKAA